MGIFNIDPYSGYYSSIDPLAITGNKTHNPLIARKSLNGSGITYTHILSDLFFICLFITTSYMCHLTKVEELQGTALILQVDTTQHLEKLKC